MLARDVQAAIAGGATVVTATRRLARWIARAWDDAREATGETAWRAAEALPYGRWVQRTWLQLRDLEAPGAGPHLLSAAQTRVLWRRVLRDLPPMEGAILPEDAAASCQRAWRLVNDYGLTPAEVAAEGGEDARRFAEAAAAYGERCRDARWTDAESLTARVATASPAALARALPGRVVFVGFDSPTPARSRLVGALEAAGIAVDRYAAAAASVTAQVSTVCCPDTEREILDAALWARARLEADPESRIGLVLAQPDDWIGSVADALDDVLTPGRILPRGHGARERWNLYLDEALADWPLASAALRALSFALGPVPLPEVGLVLRSPYLGGAAAEGGSRARLDVWLRNEGYFELSLDTLSDILGDEPWRHRPDCPRLAAQLEAAVALRPAGGLRRSADAWAGHFSELLALLGWPGGRLDSEEYQVARRWREALVEFGSLERVMGPLTAAEALTELKRVVRDIRFQPEGEPAPVEVVGLLDAVGLGFDASRVVGLHDGALPRPLQPDPLLPAGLQRRLGMPRSDAAAERAFARRWLDGILRTAGEVVLSWPEREEDRALRANPLLRPFPATAPADRAYVPYAETLCESSRLETLPDFRIGPLAAGESPGGTDLLRQQSDCPFRAQAVYRLDARPLEAPRPGVDRGVSGLLVHDALERLWGDWGGLAGLPSDAQAGREIDRVLAGLIRALRPGVKHGRVALLAIERKRLAALIAELLAVERARPTFTVAGREARRTASVGPLALDLRIDRLDRSDDGTLLVIDYKTGDAKLGDWLGERMKAPQLPTYVLALDGEPVAVAVASLKAGQVGYVGLGGDGEFGRGIHPVAAKSAASKLADDWAGLTRLWRRWLVALAEAYQAGDARVDPRDPEVCRYCHLTTLCRRHELAREAVDDEQS